MAFAEGYIDVASRIVEFRDKHPEGSLQPADLAKPFEVVTMGEQTFIVVVAAAYRGPGDERPGIGMAYEQFPGRTPYTRGSELQNAETSAWGRAIVAALAADTRKGVASADEVRNRQAEREQEQPADPALTEAKARVWKLAQERGWTGVDLGREYVEQSGGKALSNATADELNAYAEKLGAQEGEQQQ